ncbi:hypothetical protein G7046_g6160 [Stylonectria norvegica]|nr:hypothetical protein G7046_g6160 [Stylonectria norvegica]
MVVNMQEFYATELDAEKERNKLLQAQQEQLKKKLEVMERQLQTNGLLMEGVVTFMMRVKEGTLTVGKEPHDQEIEEPYDEEIEEVVETTHSSDAAECVEPAKQLSLRLPRRSRVVRRPIEESPEEDQDVETTQFPEDAELGYVELPSQDLPRDDIDLLPPTPDMNTTPVRSTGARAPKRRFPQSAPSRRKIRRRVGMSPQQVEEWNNREQVEEALSDLSYCQEERQLVFTNRRSTRAHSESSSGDVSQPEGVCEPLQQRRRTRWRAINVTSEVGSPGIEDGVERGERDSDYNPDSDNEEDAEGIEGLSRSSSRSSSPALPSPTPSFASSDASSIPHTTPSTPSDPSSSSSKPRYSAPRQTGYRFASGPASRPFAYHRMPKTVRLVWQEWKEGSNGNPPIEALEQEYGTGWRGGTLKERKYASNYVGVRQKMVRKVEEMCESEGIGPEEACRRLDARVDGRMVLLVSALRAGKDPLKVIPKR